jgi:hypothetical protein
VSSPFRISTSTYPSPSVPRQTRSPSCISDWSLAAVSDVRQCRRHRGGDEWPDVPVFAETWSGRANRSEIKVRFYDREIDSEGIEEG